MCNFSDNGHAFMFQGVGLEYKKYFHSLQEEHKRILESFFSRCKSTIGVDLPANLTEEDESSQNSSFVDLIAIFTINCAVYDIYIRNGLKPDFFLGYSMGLYTALVSGGAITFEQGLQLLAGLYKALALENTRFRGGMAIIIGLTYGEVDEIIKKVQLEDKVEIASENNSSCIVISGHKESVEKVMEAADNEGALRTKDIDVLFPYHSRFVKNGSDAYVSYAEKFDIKDSSVPIISSFDQNIVINRNDIMKEIKRCLTGRMFWKRSIEKVAGAGINSFVEVGLGNSLSKLSKIINSNITFLTFDKLTGR